ncbi:hypothetical protein [Natrinema sp. DC36]|nr:hypothetical protein [Natrinema sp. DC36]
MDGGGGPVIPLDGSSKGSDSPWVIVIILLFFLALIAMFYIMAF